MKKWDTLGLSTIVLILVLFAAAVISTKYPQKEGDGITSATASAAPECCQQPVFSLAGSGQSQEGENGSSDQNQNSQTWAIVAALAGLAAAVIYAIQAVLMRQTMIQSNRAAVFIQIFNSSWIHDIEDEEKVIAWKIEPIWKNSGNTATKELRLYTTVVVCLECLPANYEFPDVNQWPVGKSIIGPDTTLRGPYGSFDIESGLQARIGKRFIYVYGWAEYFDRFWFTRVHRTEFCSQIMVYGDPAKKECSFGFPLHTEHNGADEECPKRRIQRWKKIPPTNPLLKRNVPTPEKAALQSEQSVSARDIPPT